MTISTLLSPERIFINTAISSKKRLLEFIAKQVSEQFELTQSQLYTNLLDRERLGSTGLGKGFAVPHARLPFLDHAVGLFIKLDEPINFDAPDDQPVDLVFTIIIPEDAIDQHLQTLSSLARVFSQDSVCEAIRKVGSIDEVMEIIDSAEQ